MPYQNTANRILFRFVPAHFPHLSFFHSSPELHDVILVSFLPLPISQNDSGDGTKLYVLLR